MVWNAMEIKKLRLRLGWSRAEMARHLSCHENQVEALEKSQLIANKEFMDQLEHLSNYAEALAKKIQRDAVAENRLNHQNLDQIYCDDLETS